MLWYSFIQPKSLGIWWDLIQFKLLIWDLNPPKFISLDESIESHGYNMLLMLGLNQTLSISISLIPKNSEKRILLCSAMIYGLKQEHMN